MRVEKSKGDIRFVLAFEEAMIWRDQGGGRRARHCEAMALFALGHEDEAAHRLDQLASGADGGSDVMRSNFRLEAANFWLAAAEAEKAKASVMAGLEYETNHTHKEQYLRLLLNQWLQ